MRSPKKIALASLAMLLLGCSAVLGQAYEPNGDYYAPDGGHVVCGGTVNLAHIVNWTIDPATGMRITREQYEARYPWANSVDWTYDCASNLWTYVGAQQTAAPVYQGPAYYQAPAYYQGSYRESRNVDRNRGNEQTRGSEQNRGHADRNQANDQHRDRGREGDRH